MNFVVEEQPKDADGKPIEGTGTIKRNEVRTLNSMQPLWAKNKSEIKQKNMMNFIKISSMIGKDQWKLCTIRLKVLLNIHHCILPRTCTV